MARCRRSMKTFGTVGSHYSQPDFAMADGRCRVAQYGDGGTALSGNTGRTRKQPKIGWTGNGRTPEGEPPRLRASVH